MPATPPPFTWTRPFRTPEGAFGVIDSGCDPEDPTLVRIELHDPTLPYTTMAEVHAGRVIRVEYRAQRGERITQRQLRSPNLVSFFERWAAIVESAERARLDDDLHRQLSAMLNGIEGEGAADLLNALENGLAEHRASVQRGRVRGRAADELLAQVVRDYKAAVAAGDPSPRASIARRLGYSPEHIGRLLVKARRTNPPMLGPALRGRAGEDES